MDDPDPLSAHPVYLVGQDGEGHWVVVEQHGRGGGLFVSREAALNYVGFETGHDPAACRITPEPIGSAFGARGEDRH